MTTEEITAAENTTAIGKRTTTEIDPLRHPVPHQDEDAETIAEAETEADATTTDAVKTKG